MITPNSTPWEPRLWRSELKVAFRTSHALLQHLGLPADAADDALPFATLVPRGYAARMETGNPHDPLLKQVLTTAQERLQVVGFESDPLLETDEGLGFTLAPGLLQKYAGRALLITTGACAIHCRYCFRRHFPYAEHRTDRLDAALSALAADQSIEEIILSGGDPLMLDDEAFAGLIGQLADIKHIQRIRIHTRMPIVLPERVTENLLKTLARARPPIVLVVHTNHANELDGATARALACLSSVCAQLLNQAVALQSINDSAPAQIELAKRLFDQGVLPYYLHLPDKVAGTAHFFLGVEQVQAIYTEMRAALPGYLLPKLVREAPGETSKLILSG